MSGLGGRVDVTVLELHGADLSEGRVPPAGVVGTRGFSYEQHLCVAAFVVFFSGVSEAEGQVNRHIVTNACARDLPECCWKRGPAPCCSAEPMLRELIGPPSR